MDRMEKLRELERLRAEVARLETELIESPAGHWAPPDYYSAYHILAGMVLGLMGACSSLLFNVVGAVLAGLDSPLQLIRVYLTFPMGEKALAVNEGFAIAAGCGLYLCTGAALGVPIHMLLSRYFPTASVTKRLLVVTLAGLGLWLVNFYALLSWLQPALFGGNWIVREIPWWVAMLTHLVFVWTLLLVDRWGSFVPYRTADSVEKTS
jgi:hypothetical protein